MPCASRRLPTRRCKWHMICCRDDVRSLSPPRTDPSPWWRSPVPPGALYWRDDLRPRLTIPDASDSKPRLPRRGLLRSLQSASKQQDDEHDDNDRSQATRIPAITVLPRTNPRCADECEDQQNHNHNPEQIHNASRLRRCWLSCSGSPCRTVRCRTDPGPSYTFRVQDCQCGGGCECEATSGLARRLWAMDPVVFGSATNVPAPAAAAGTLRRPRSAPPGAYIWVSDFGAGKLFELAALRRS
jgi:hypothetical protein